mgnify:CR=1 FL=1
MPGFLAGAYGRAAGGGAPGAFGAADETGSGEGKGFTLNIPLEAGATDGWRKYVGAIDDPRAAVVGIDRFGESAPAAALFNYFGFTSEHVADAVRRVAVPERNST